MRDFDPIAIVRKAIKSWAKHFVPLVLLCAMNIVPFVFWRLAKKVIGPWGSVQPDLLGIVAFLCAIALSAFIYLAILSYYKKAVREETASFFSAFKDAISGISRYLETGAFFFLFLIVMAAAGFLVWTAGRICYVGPGPQGLKTIALLASSTAFVVCLITAVWYGFFFLLAPLIAAFEKKGPLASFRESRSRIRGNALGLLSALLIYFVFYVAVGLSLVALAKYMTQDRWILNLIDPVLSVVLGPLGLLIWFESYVTLTELRVSRSASQPVSRLKEEELK